MTGYDQLLFIHFIGDMIGYDRDMTGYGITYYITYFLNEQNIIIITRDMIGYEEVNRSHYLGYDGI